MIPPKISQSCDTFCSVPDCSGLPGTRDLEGAEPGASLNDTEKTDGGMVHVAQPL